MFLRQRERVQRHDEIVAEAAYEDPRALSREAPVFAASHDSDPEGAFFQSIVDEEILAAIDALPGEYRMAVVLSDLEDLSYNEIAEVMEVPGRNREESIVQRATPASEAVIRVRRGDGVYLGGGWGPIDDYL